MALIDGSDPAGLLAPDARAVLREDPVATLTVSSGVGPEAVLGDRADDSGPGGLGVLEVGVEVVHVDEGRVSPDLAPTSPQHDEVGAETELDPGVVGVPLLIGYVGCGLEPEHLGKPTGGGSRGGRPQGQVQLAVIGR